MQDQVKIVEVGARDGLQNERTPLSTAIKSELILKLAGTGLRVIEIGSFVSPKWVPQMADTALVFDHVKSLLASHISLPALVLNKRGAEDAIHAGVKELAVLGGVSETFSQKNMNCSIETSLNRSAEIIALAKPHNIKVRGYISCALGCPYEGKVAFEAIAKTAMFLRDAGCYEISLGDTIGVGTPHLAQALISHISQNIDIQQLAIHFHDTYGQALANIYACLEKGIRVIDASVSGLGGCPYAKGAAGNVATEDVIYLLNGLNIKHGVDLNKLVQTSYWISQQLNKTPISKVAQAMGSL